MTLVNASASGTFSLGGELPVHRLGYGAMRITGAGIWGPPQDRAACLRTLRRLAELGVNFIDTADSYGPDVSEELLREALHPYAGMVIATKGGLMRGGPDQWTPNGRPDHLIAQARRSLKKLGVEQISLWQLHRIDPQVPRDEQFGAVKQLLDEGVIRHAGLSEVSVEEIEAARKIFPVASVQNLYNVTNRTSESVVDYCEQHRIGFIPWYPLAAGDLVHSGSVLGKIAKAHGVTRSQVALAWILRRSPVMLPIPGTSKIEHLEENVAAAGIHLSAHNLADLDRLGKVALSSRAS